MSSKRQIGYEVSDEPRVDQLDVEEAEVIEEEVGQSEELRPSVIQERQAKIDGVHPDAVSTGMSLEDEEKMAAREWEIARTNRRWDKRQESSREARTRGMVESKNAERRYEVATRAASVDPWADPERRDAREQLARAELSQVNREAARLAGELRGWTSAAISRRLAEHVVDGMEMLDAVVRVFEALQQGPGQVLPIDAVERVDEYEVDVEGRVSVLWKPSCAAIAQVGLLEDESGRIKFTSWAKSGKPLVREGDVVRFRSVAKNWYEGRCSVALTGRSRVVFPERKAGL